MFVGVLGPLYISLEGVSGHVELAPKPRTALAVLMANAGVVVPASSLVREVWGDDPPVSGLRNIQTYVLQSRKVLARFTGKPARAVAGELLMTRPGGYVFSDACAQFDYDHYGHLVAEGRDAIRRGDPERGVPLLDRALRLWRGPAFVDVVTGCILEAQRRKWEESKLAVIETLSSAKIEMGQHYEAAADLTACVFEHPLHEGLHYQYMRALSMAGDRAHALDVFSQLRLNLVAELGIEPSDVMRELQYSILNS
ncbi:AfsR/SARP family transcriptional regulator [Streptacidiphilus sp. P02-A3a]|uniref:AfsR/SARP family transcriptional regulator n=1 Tax=Streptacidiphilus sp. P02-A3a TaxID=2704468 RepID=UPI0015F9C8E0|nr:AfsR/SARP family transcriptional regulator [Streptacidiphilus sp. P02-A3a]QMU71551.1 AfsR/SARP family transcriptional regulator [Streptacidiphilus sp. P02-A3a]